MKALLALGWCLLMLPHPETATIGRATWRPERGVLEVDLCIDPQLLNDALDRHHGRRIDLDRLDDAALGELIKQYVGTQFLVLDGRGVPAKLTWIGQRITIDEALLYFELALPGGAQGMVIEQRMLFDLAIDDPVNLLNLSWGKAYGEPRFTRRQPAFRVDWSGPAPTLTATGGR